MTTTAPLLHLGDSILYVSSLIADQPREIDRYVDYFGGLSAARRSLGVGANIVLRAALVRRARRLLPSGAPA